MLYQCRQCEHVEARGCLPTATCGLYFFGLMALTYLFWEIGLRIVHALIVGDQAQQPANQPQPDPPWWMWPVSACVSLLLSFLGAVALDLTFRFIEFVLARQRPCPSCGARKWSKGFTSGFGL